MLFLSNMPAILVEAGFVTNKSDAKRLRALEDENGKLKKLLAEQMLDNAMLRDINSKKW